MKVLFNFFYFLAGMITGVTLIQSQAASWYRIQEMFQFGSFQLYGVILSAVVVGMIGVQLLKGKRSLEGAEIKINDKNRTWTRYIVGGTIFGLGWAIAGACPGPTMALIGAGWPGFVVLFVGMILGTWVYGLLRDVLPH